MTPATNEFTHGPSDGVELSESGRHDLLSSERRRTLLDVLESGSTPVELAALAASVHARERGTPTGGPGAREAVAIALHHVHLPKLDEAGVVDYDAVSGRVERVPDRVPR